MHLLLTADYTAPCASRVVEDVQLLVYNHFWANTRHDVGDNFEPPMIVDPPGLERVIGHAYVAHQRPGNIFTGEGLPYVHLMHDNLRISSLTHIETSKLGAFQRAIGTIVQVHSDFFTARDSDPIDSEPFGDATPDAVRDVVRGKPELRKAINECIADGIPSDMSMHCAVQAVINDPCVPSGVIAGVCTGAEYGAIVEQGYL